MGTVDDETQEIDATGLARWLAENVDPAITSVSVTRLAGGHSSGAWRIDVEGARSVGPLVLKAPAGVSVVYQRDAGREARIMDGLARNGGRVPAIVAIDTTGAAIGRSCFVMEHVDGTSPDDTSLAGHHDDARLAALDTEAQHTIWLGFYDALASLHAVDGAAVPDASHGPNGLADVIAYWRTSLLDEATPDLVPRQLALLDWLGANLPPGADDDPAPCMGDARLVNALIDGTDVRALVDFEVAYLGNPAADVGYSLFLDGLHRQSAATPLPGIGTADEAWSHWSAATGRAVEHREYWPAFAAMVLAVTATRAMVQWGLASATLESDNPIVAAWESAVDVAAGR